MSAHACESAWHRGSGCSRWGRCTLPARKEGTGEAELSTAFPKSGNQLVHNMEAERTKNGFTSGTLLRIMKIIKGQNEEKRVIS